jgi:ATP-binding cassette, subfamily B, bacterial
MSFAALRQVSRLGFQIAAFALLAAVGRLAVPVVVERMLDGRALLVPQLPVSVVIGVGVAVVACIGACVAGMRLYTGVGSLVTALRLRAFDAAQRRLPREQTRDRDALVAGMTRDVDEVDRFVDGAGGHLAIGAGQLILASALMATYSWQLTVTMLLALAPVGLLAVVVHRRLAAMYVALQTYTNALLGLVRELVSRAPTSRGRAARDHAVGRVDSSMRAGRRAALRTLRLHAAGIAAIGLLGAAAVTSAAALGVALRLDERVTAYQLVVVLVLGLMLIRPVRLLADAAVAGWPALVGIRRTVRQPTPVIMDVPAGRPLPTGPIDIRFAHVSVDDGAAEKLAEVDLRITAGSFVAVVGRPGSGRGLLADLMTGVVAPTRGEVLLGGVRLTDVAPASLRCRVITLPRNGFLFAGTVADNIRLGRPELTDAEVYGAIAQLGLDGWVESLNDGLRTVVGERGVRLSATDRQLVGLARAHVARPDVLIISDGGVDDPSLDGAMLRAMERAACGRTTIVVARRLRTAQIADEVVVFDDGRPVERGQPAELLANPDSYFARFQLSCSTAETDVYA